MGMVRKIANTYKQYAKAKVGKFFGFRGRTGASIKSMPSVKGGVAKRGKPLKTLEGPYIMYNLTNAAKKVKKYKSDSASPSKDPGFSDMTEVLPAIITKPIRNVGVSAQFENKFIVMMPTSDGAKTASSHIYKYRNSRKQGQLMGTFSNAYDYRFSLSSTLGNQAVSDLVVLGTTNSASYPTTYAIPNFGTLQDMMSSIPNPGNVTNPVETKKMYVRNIQSLLSIKATGVPVRVTIYECIPKYDNRVTTAGYSSGTNIQNGMNSYGSPTFCFNQGLSGTAQPSSGYASNEAFAYDPGMTPNKLLLFNTFWTVQKKVTVDMDGAQLHTHRSLYAINTLFNSYRLSTAEPNVLQGVSPVMMLVVQGLLNNANDYPPATVNFYLETKVSYASPALTQTFTYSRQDRI